MSKPATRVCAIPFHDPAVRAAYVEKGDKLDGLTPELEAKLDGLGLLEPAKGSAPAA